MKIVIRFIILSIGLAMGCSCKDNASPVVKLFKAHLGKEICLEGFKEVYSEKDTLSYSDFRKRYPFLHVNYIDEECGSCLVKIREWYKRSESLSMYDKLAYEITDEFVSWVENKLNNRPRKRLGYLTPNEKFNSILTN